MTVFPLGALLLLEAMKKLLMSLVLGVVLISGGALGAAPMCSQLFETGPGRKYFSDKGPRIFRSTSLGKEIVYDFKPAKKKKTTWILIHGLGDDMSKLQQLAELADRDGNGILRVDLFGHGETLRRYMNTHDQAIPGDLYYKDNITAIQEMLKSFGVKDVVIVGHSYGGGITYGLAEALAAVPGKGRVRVRSVHMLAPYVQRIDKFLKNYFQSPQFLLHQTAVNMEKFGTPADTVKSIMDPLFRMTWAMTAGYRYMNGLMTNALKVDQWQDLAMDPLMETYIKKSYRKYFVAMIKKSEGELTAADNADVDIRVEAAIKVTKGIRDFDLLDTTTELRGVGAPLQVIGGINDPLVMPGQLYEFEQRLELNHIPHKLEFINGAEAHHLFPRLMAEETYRMIRAYQEQHP
jgi:pimeloyl-ACP methyl ester carboxylesterase